ncbi:hypothetical protein EV07_1921 [Prochlorococcus sp. MIT 0603]|nr:hypothetical protein EV07_1921 [Prochlorococcus sp. MIT 0603]
MSTSNACVVDLYCVGHKALWITLHVKNFTQFGSTKRN